MAINEETIISLMDYLEGTVEEIRKMDVTKEKIEQDFVFAAAVKYLIQTAVECCANITEHLVFGLNLGHPDTTRELFPLLVQEKIIDQDLSEKFAKAVGLRNILVHQYKDVDSGILANSATVGLNDLHAFTKSIYNFLQKDSSKP